MRMSMKAAVVTAATTALFVPVASALAASTAIVDSKKDTWTVTYDDQNVRHVQKSDVNKNVDVKKTVITFGKRVEVKQTFVTLSKDGVSFMPGALLKTSTGDSVYMQGLANHDGDTWTDGGYLITGPQSGRVSARATDCNNLRTNINWSTGVFTMSAPSSCLGKNVKWVKVHANNIGQSYDATTDTYTNYVDNAHNDKANDKGWTGRINKG